MKLYIAVLDSVPDYMVPTLVAHSVLGAHLKFCCEITPTYGVWIETSYKKCVLRVNQKEFDKIAAIEGTYLGHENTVNGGTKSCAVPFPVPNEQLPNVLKFAKLWKPK